MRERERGRDALAYGHAQNDGVGREGDGGSDECGLSEPLRFSCTATWRARAQLA